jgi:hypothetical protein
MTDPQDGDPADGPKPDGSNSDGRTSPNTATAVSGTEGDIAHGSDPQATTELPRAGWEHDTETQRVAGRTWSPDDTHNFPAYRPQSYPTYPPSPSHTSELPEVDAGGPPPPAAAAYGGPARVAAGPPTTGATTPQPERRRRAGAGWAGALAVIGIAAAAFGGLALPLQRLGPRTSPVFATLRELSTHTVTATSSNAHSVSLAGGHAATLWWRYGFLGVLGLLTLLLLVLICIPVLRRAAGVLLFLGGLAAIVAYAFALRQTNDYRAVTGGIRNAERLSVGQFGVGLWVSLAGCLVVAVGGLIAAFQSTRR